MKFSCVILAAGSGERFGDKKQFYTFNGKTLWEHVLDKCEKVCDDIVVVGVDIRGGKYRQDSVRMGINEIDNERVVILDAVRPLVTSEQILKIAQHDFISVSYAIRPTDTIIFNQIIINRDNCKLLQVPQAFDTDKLISAHKHTDYKNATDDTKLIQECFGVSPDLLEGGRNLFKVTYPDDMKILEAIK